MACMEMETWKMEMHIQIKPVCQQLNLQQKSFFLKVKKEVYIY